MAKDILGLSAYFTIIVYVSAISWTAAPSTKSVAQISGTLVSRGVASPPSPVPTDFEPPHICGYVDYSSGQLLFHSGTTFYPNFVPGNSYTCGGRNTCLWNSHLKLVGCGNPTSIDYVTSCIPYKALKYCDTSCFSNPSILKWYAPSLPHERKSTHSHLSSVVAQTFPIV